LTAAYCRISGVDGSVIVSAAGADYNKFKVARFHRFRVSKLQRPKSDVVQCSSSLKP
jgi:hypothetical protein